LVGIDLDDLDWLNVIALDEMGGMLRVYCVQSERGESDGFYRMISLKQLFEIDL